MTILAEPPARLTPPEAWSLSPHEGRVPDEPVLVDNPCEIYKGPIWHLLEQYHDNDGNRLTTPKFSIVGPVPAGHPILTQGVGAEWGNEAVDDDGLPPMRFRYLGLVEKCDERDRQWLMVGARGAMRP